MRNHSTAAGVTRHLKARRPPFMINTVKKYEYGHDPCVAQNMLIATMYLYYFLKPVVASSWSDP